MNIERSLRRGRKALSGSSVAWEKFWKALHYVEVREEGWGRVAGVLIFIQRALFQFQIHSLNFAKSEKASWRR